MKLQEFKVGDRVVCNVNGLGIVIENCTSSIYPVVVYFSDKSIETYNKHGRMYNDVDEDDGEHIRHLTKLELALS